MFVVHGQNDMLMPAADARAFVDEDARCRAAR